MNELKAVRRQMEKEINDLSSALENQNTASKGIFKPCGCIICSLQFPSLVTLEAKY